MQEQKLMDSQQLQQSFAESLQENEICCVKHIENDVGFGIFVENISYFNNKDFQAIIVPAQNPYNKENPYLYLTINPNEDSEENVKLTGIIDFTEEFKKQKYLDIIYDDEDLELKDMGSIFAEYFSKNEYQFVQDKENENQVQLDINTKLLLGKKEKDVKFQFLLNKQIIEQEVEVEQEQNLEKQVETLQNTIKNQNKEVLKLQNEIKNQNQEQKQILEIIQTFITQQSNQQNEKIEKLLQMEKEFQTDITQNVKIIQQENSDLKQNINNIQQNQVQNFQTIKQQLTNLQEQYNNNIKDKVNNNNDQNLNNQISELKKQIETKYQYQTQQNDKILQNQQELEQVLQQNQNNNNENLQNIEQLNQSSQLQQQQIDEVIIKQIKYQISQNYEYLPSAFQISKILTQYKVQSYEILEEICKYAFSERELIFYTHNKLQNAITLFKDPSLTLYLSIMIPLELDSKLNPVSIFKSNINDIEIEQFQDLCKDKKNCLILTKIKETKTSDYIVYGGYAPDSFIFNQEQKLYNTEETEEWNQPFTFNLNQKIKRNLQNQNQVAYQVIAGYYFIFYQDFYIIDNSTYNYSFSNDVYWSFDQEENDKQKQIINQKFVDLEIEVIQLF